LETCIERDPKGMYKKALTGEIKNFTGISSPYEAPENPELVIDTEKLGIKEAANCLVDYLLEKEIVRKGK